MEDTFRPAFLQVARHLALSGFVQKHLRYSVQETLEQLENPSSDMRSIDLQLQNDDTSVDLYVRDGRRYEWEPEDLVTDDAGNVFCPASIEIRLNYPSHGQTDIATLGRRIELLNGAYELAKHLQDEFGNVTYYRLFRTKEEIDAANKDKEDRRIREIVRRQVDAQKGMRVGSIREVGVEQSIPDGIYYHTDAHKVFRIEVANNGSLATITRVK
jgi:hypothetical protein